MNPANTPHQIQEPLDWVSATDNTPDGAGQGQMGGRTCEANGTSKLLMLKKACESITPLVVTISSIAACTTAYLVIKSNHPNPTPPYSGKDILDKTFFATVMLGMGLKILELEDAPSKLVKKVNQALIAITPIVPPAVFAGLTMNRLLQGSSAPPWISKDDTAIGMAWYAFGALGVGGMCLVGIHKRFDCLYKMIMAPSNSNVTHDHPDSLYENTATIPHEKQS